MTAKKPASVLCFGEVLWDILPEGMKPGGAPLNVAYHLSRTGVNSSLISRVGKDDLGRQLLAQMKSWNLSASLFQEDERYPTGTVVAEMDEHHEVAYTIVAPVAWDFIHWEQRYAAASEADALVFGSLIMRNIVSYETLEGLLSASSYRVFDVNLREPHVEQQKILSALAKTELLKLNQHELGVIGSWIGPEAASESDTVHRLQDRFSIPGIILTRGKDGATYYEGGQVYTSRIYPVKVADTVGSGDAFLAAFLSARFAGKMIDQSLDAAAALGAFVASRQGACPDYTPSEGSLFLEGKGLKAVL